MNSNPNGNFQNTSIVDYLEKTYFATPDYQRAYSWKSPESLEIKDDRIRYQVKEFWDDIIRWYKDERKSEKNYYLGTIVLSSVDSKDESNNGKKSGCQNIVDGQQRLITLYILYIALVDWYREKGVEKLLEDAAKKILYIPKSDWDGDRSTYVSRMVLSGEDEVYLNKLLDFIKAGNQIAMDSSTKESNIGQAFNFFRESIQKFAEDGCANNKGESQVKVVANLDEYIENRLYAAVVVTEDEIRAHAVFETLNDRGIPLGAEDLIKNYLFSRAGNKYKTVIQRWNDISKHINKIGEKADDSAPDLSQFDKFIQSYMISFSAPLPVGNNKNKKWVVDNSIFPCFKQWFTYRTTIQGTSLTDEESVDLITKELEHAAHMYTALHSVDYWNQYLFEEKEPADHYIQLIKLLGHVNSMDQKNWYAHLYPLFFSVLSYIDERKESIKQGNEKDYRKNYKLLRDEVLEFTDFMESYIFRTYIMLDIKAWNSRVIRSDKFAGISQRIRDRKYNKLVDVFGEKGFNHCFSPESTDEFKKHFSTYHIYKTGGISEEDPYKQFAKYILRKLENRRQEDKKSELKVFEYGGESSLEHIFPVKYSKEEELSGWEAFWDEGLEKYKTDYIFRVGNYTILHYKLNSKVSDGPWDEKRKHLKDSKIIHTVNIAKNYDRWTPEVIDEVQRKLADEVVEVWNSPRGKKEAK